jgi:hypothetical protein
MSGIYNGVQEKISKKVENAPYVHCAAHNLNLILNDAVKNVETDFFLIVEKIYTYFGNSILRWGLLYPDKGIKNIKLKKTCPYEVVFTTRCFACNAIQVFRYFKNTNNSIL